VSTDTDTMIEELYLAGVTDQDNNKKDLTAVEISNELAIPLQKVRQVIFGEDETGTSPECAYKKKQLLGDRIPVKSFVKYKGHIFLKAQATAMSVLQRGLEGLDAKKDLSIADLKDISAIIGTIDKMQRLEMGMPTDIVKNMNLKPERIIAIIKSDPMYGGNKDGDTTDNHILSGDRGTEGSEVKNDDRREDENNGGTGRLEKETSDKTGANLELFPNSGQ